MTAGGLRSWLGSCSSRPRFLALAAFLFAGDLKADPRLAWLPVDLTLLTGSLLSGVLVLRWARGARLRSLQPLVLLGGWYLTFLPGLAQVAPTDYAFQKVATLGTFTLLSALAPLFLVQDRADLARLANALAYFCLAITLAGLLGGVRSDQTVERLQAFGAGTISLGRATGFLFIRAAAALWEVDPERGVGRQYPHNLMAEVTLESGWACGAATLLVLVAAAVAAWSRTGSPGGRLVFAGLLFYAINAMVSGDLNDNRPLFMFLGSAFLGLDLRPEEAT